MQTENIQDALIDGILTLQHSFHRLVEIKDIIILVLRVLRMTAACLTWVVRRISDDHLAKFAHEEPLPAREQAHERGRSHSLSLDKLDQVQLLPNRLFRLEHPSLVTLIAKDQGSQAAFRLDLFPLVELMIDQAF